MAKMTLNELVTQLRAAHGDALRAVVLYGSTAAEGASDDAAGHNVLVVVNGLTMASMRAAGATARAWIAGGHLVPLTLTQAEWKASVDVFAIEHADIAAQHRVLWAAGGFDLLAGLRPAQGDIRRQLEYEAMGLLLRVRAGIASVGNDVDQGRALLAASSGAARAQFRALYRLTGEAPPADQDELCRAIGQRAGFDAAPFIAAGAERRAPGAVDRAMVGETLGGFHIGLERLVAYLDSFVSSS